MEVGTNKAYEDDIVKGSDNFTSKETQEVKTKELNTKKKTEMSAILSGLRYKVDDKPPWHTTILLGFQHYILLLSSNLATPGIMATIMCAKNNTEVTSILLGNMLFACGICTLIQTFLGARLPIVQCPAFAYIVPMLAMVQIDKTTCPQETNGNSTLDLLISNGTTSEPPSDSQPIWQERLSKVSGSIMVVALLEIFVGASGLLSILLRFIGPLTVAPTIMLMGLGVAKTGFELAGQHWAISGATICLIVLFSECIPVFKIPNPCSGKCGKGSYQTHGNGKVEVVFHKLFSVILSVCVMWLFCYILTVTDVFPTSKDVYGFHARTDIRTDVLHQAPWFSFPYPGKYGGPTIDVTLLVAFIPGVVTSVVESIGDYYTCARIAGAVPPPSSAVNRGILLEGVDCIISAAVGSGFGVTSCSQNIGVISLTKVGSRRVVLVAGAIMMIMACISKLSAFVVTVPDPIVGAAFIVLFGVLAAVGASNLQYVDLNSSRNMIVFGMALFVGLSSPIWVDDNQNFFTGEAGLGGQVATALLGNSMFMACFTALVLDNVMPGTAEERGILLWRKIEEDDGSTSMSLTLKTYDLPFGMEYIRRASWTKYVPFLPTFMGIDNMCLCRNSKSESDQIYDKKNAQRDYGAHDNEFEVEIDSPNMKNTSL